MHKAGRRSRLHLTTGVSDPVRCVPCSVKLHSESSLDNRSGVHRLRPWQSAAALRRRCNKCKSPQKCLASLVLQCSGTERMQEDRFHDAIDFSASLIGTSWFARLLRSYQRSSPYVQAPTTRAGPAAEAQLLTAAGSNKIE